MAAPLLALQLHQLDSEVLQHAQQTAERFGSKGNRLPKSAHQSEGNPFADAGPSGHLDDLPSQSEDDAGEQALQQVPNRQNDFLALAEYA